MSSDALPVFQRAAQLRRDFDQAFAVPPVRPSEVPVDLLAIRLGAEPYALSLAEVRGLFADTKLTRLPQSVPAFLGLAGFRGNVVPVYDLRELIGHAGGKAPRWLVVAVAGEVALAFDSFDGHLRLSQRAIVQAEGAAARAHVRGLARTSGGASAGTGSLRPILNLVSILETIEHGRRGSPTSQLE